MSSNGGPRQVFGQTMHRKNAKYGSKNSSNYQRQFGGTKGATDVSSKGNDPQLVFNDYRARKEEMMHQVESSFGLQRFVYEENQSSGEISKRGWLYNMIQTTVSFTYCLLHIQIFGILAQRSASLTSLLSFSLCLDRLRCQMNRFCKAVPSVLA